MHLFAPARIRRAALLVFTLLGAAAVPAASADVLVSSGSQPAPFSQNKQNEPALAVDAKHPQMLASGSNDEIDTESCAAGDGTTCPFTAGVGVSGIYLSFDGGTSWTQPTYPGYSARTCQGPAPCTPLTPAQGGQIGTLPNYYENGLASDGDAALAFGPVYRNGKFSWDNGSRLYYANLTSSLADSKQASAFRGFEALAVSTTDDPRAAALGGVTGQRAWSAPVIISKQSSTTFSDKEQLWADNAESSKYFGYVYVCNASFRSNSKGNGAPEPIVLSRSSDGGRTWSSRQISSAGTNANNPGRDGCTVRTDHLGVVYAYYRGIDPKTKVEAQLQSRSYNGGATFETPRAVSGPAQTVGIIDPTIQRPVEDGLAGARADLAPAPSVDIANGAPSGADATDAIVMAWATGDSSPFHYGDAVYASSTNHGTSFSGPRAIALPGHAYYVAPALSPDGKRLYLAYNTFASDFQTTTGSPRSLTGGLLSAPFDSATGTPTAPFASQSSPASGDPRASSQNNLVAEFLGDYVYAVGTRSGGAGVWNDVRNGADCPQVDAYRQTYENAVRSGSIPPNAQEDSREGYADAPASGSTGTPPPPPDVYGGTTPCPSNFGNTDIYGASTIVAP